jgi:L-rhamnose isomerase
MLFRDKVESVDEIKKHIILLNSVIDKEIAIVEKNVEKGTYVDGIENLTEPIQDLIRARLQLIQAYLQPTYISLKSLLKSNYEPVYREGIAWSTIEKLKNIYDKDIRETIKEKLLRELKII